VCLPQLVTASKPNAADKGHRRALLKRFLREILFAAAKKPGYL
jgi:hypothetical protein